MFKLNSICFLNLLVCCSFLFFSGCATVLKGVGGDGVSKQSISINSSPTEANVKIIKEGQDFLKTQTNTSTELPRKGKNYKVIIEKEGFEPQTQVIERRLVHCIIN